MLRMCRVVVLAVAIVAAAIWVKRKTDKKKTVLRPAI
jgi:hypothetical protein